VTKYKVEWWTRKVVSEVQVLRVTWASKPASGKILIGTYSNDVAQFVTQQAPHDTSALNMRKYVMDIGGSNPVFGDVTVTRSSINTDKGFAWTITFNDHTKNVGDIPELVLQKTDDLEAACPTCTYYAYQMTSGQRASNAPTVVGNREIQVISPDQATSAVTGWWRAKFKGSAYSQYLPHDATETAVIDALEGLATVGKVFVSRDAETNGFAWSVTFDTNVGDQEAIVLDTSMLSQPLTVYDGANNFDHTGSYADNNLACGGNDCAPLCPVSATIGTCSVGETPVEYGVYETSDASVLTYQIPQLTPGTMYYVAVSAQNERGYGERQFSTPGSVAPPKQRPGKPTNVQVDVQYGDYQRLQVTYGSPLSTGGDEPTKYRVEWDTSISFPNPGKEEFICPNSPKRAVWTVDTGNTNGNAITSGHFFLTVTRGGLQYSTAAMPYNAPPMMSDEAGNLLAASTVTCDADYNTNADCDPKASGSVEGRLEALSIVNDVTVTRLPNAQGGYQWTITFKDDGDDYALAASAACNDGGAGACNLVTGSADPCTVTGTKVASGAVFTSCTGTRAVATSGGLTKGQLYYMRVFAYNSLGYSDPQIAAAPQKPMVIPSAPTGVTLEVVSSYQLKVIFSPPDDNGGDTVSKYTVQWSTDINFATVSSAEVTELSGGAPFFYTIGSLASPLDMGTFYYVRVMCANSQGDGPTVRSAPTKLNPSQPPSAPQGVILGSTSPSMLTVAFDEPASDGGDTITKYQIEWDTSPTFNSLELAPHKGVQQVAATERAYTIQLLTTNTIYYVKVSAVNGQGVGTEQKATPQFLKPELQVPGRPVSVTAQATGTPAEATISWTRPVIPHHGLPCFGTPASPTNCPTYVSGSDPQSDGGAVISKYKIQYSTDSTFAGVGTMEYEVTNAATTFTLTSAQGIQAGVEHFFRVMAYNSRGFSGISEVASLTP
jgi:hypothetical protein